MKQAVGLKAKASTARTHWAAGLGGVYIWLRIYKRGSNAPILQLSKNSVVRPEAATAREEATEKWGPMLQPMEKSREAAIGSDLTKSALPG